MYDVVGAFTITVVLALGVAIIVFNVLGAVLDHMPKTKYDGLGNAIVAGWVAMLAGGGTFVFGLIEFVGLTVQR